MTPVLKFPKSGVPDDNSNIDPTPAIAVIHDPNKNTPLFGVTIFTPYLKQLSMLVILHMN